MAGKSGPTCADTATPRGSGSASSPFTDHNKIWRRSRRGSTGDRVRCSACSRTSALSLASVFSNASDTTRRATDVFEVKWPRRFLRLQKSHVSASTRTVSRLLVCGGWSEQGWLVWFGLWLCLCNIWLVILQNKTGVGTRQNYIAIFFLFNFLKYALSPLLALWNNPACMQCDSGIYGCHLTPAEPSVCLRRSARGTASCTLHRHNDVNAMLAAAAAATRWSVMQVCV